VTEDKEGRQRVLQKKEKEGRGQEKNISESRCKMEVWAQEKRSVTIRS